MFSAKLDNTFLVDTFGLPLIVIVRTEIEIITIRLHYGGLRESTFHNDSRIVVTVTVAWSELHFPMHLIIDVEYTMMDNAR